MSATQSYNQNAHLSVMEVRGTFPSDAALQDAVTRLTDAGFDRANLVVPGPGIADADTVKPEDDRRQLRTVHSSTAAAAGAMAGAAAVVATGGAALAAVAAAAGAGVMAGGGMFAATNASDALQADARDAAAVQGGLHLVVAVADAAQESLVESAMRQAGATDVHSGVRKHATLSGSRPRYA